MPDKKLISTIYKEFLQLANSNKKDQLTTGQRISTVISPKNIYEGLIST